MLHQFRVAPFILEMLTRLPIVGNAFAKMLLVFSVELIELFLTDFVHRCPPCDLLSESLLVTHHRRCAAISTEVSRIEDGLSRPLACGGLVELRSISLRAIRDL